MDQDQESLRNLLKAQNKDLLKAQNEYLIDKIAFDRQVKMKDDLGINQIDSLTKKKKALGIQSSNINALDDSYNKNKERATEKYKKIIMEDEKKFMEDNKEVFALNLVLSAMDESTLDEDLEELNKEFGGELISNLQGKIKGYIDVTTDEIYRDTYYGPQTEESMVDTALAVKKSDLHNRRLALSRKLEENPSSDEEKKKLDADAIQIQDDVIKLEKEVRELGEKLAELKKSKGGSRKSKKHRRRTIKKRRRNIKKSKSRK